MSPDDRAARAARRAAEVVSGVRDGLTAFRDPAARLRRQRRRARWGLGVRGAPTAAVSVVAGEAIANGAEVVGGFVAVVAAAGLVSTTAAARRVWRLHHVPMPEPRPPMPPRRSVARAPIERLTIAERALAELLAILGPAAVDTGADAAAAAQELRAYAARVVAVESAGSSQAAGGLTAAVRAMGGRLADGVAGYERLVSAAGEAVAAGQREPAPLALQDLSDAADRLAGLASGLRELDRGR